MYQEFRSTFLFCYQDDKKRFYQELIGGLTVMAGALGLSLLAIGVWG